MENDVVLKVEGLKKYFPIVKGLFKKPIGYIKAVDDVSFEIKEGETLGLVGESGCGKSTVGNCIVRLLDIDGGNIYINDGDETKGISIAKLSQKELKARNYRKQVQIVFQDPYSSLNPRMTVKSIVREPIICNKMITDKKLIEKRIVDLLEQVGLQPEYLERFPHSFSGGQRQRICITRALSVNPKLLVCDEAVSALDVSIQAQILMLLKSLQDQYKIAYLFISHDFAVVRYISNNIAVMYVGKFVELSETEEMFKSPAHPYTEALLSSVYEIDFNNKKERIILEGEVANPAKPPAGCYFHPRCKYAKPICREQAPPWVQLNEKHFTACHFAGQLKLIGINDAYKADDVINRKGGEPDA